MAFWISIAQRTASTHYGIRCNRAVAGALDDTTVMHGNSRIDQIRFAAFPSLRQDAIFVRAGKPAVANTSEQRIAASFRVSLIAPVSCHSR